MRNFTRLYDPDAYRRIRRRRYAILLGAATGVALPLPLLWWHITGMVEGALRTLAAL